MQTYFCMAPWTIQNTELHVARSCKMLSQAPILQQLLPWFYINEVVHKLILAETTKTYRLRSESEAKKLIEDKPETISSLTRVWKTYAVIRAYPLVIYSIDKATMDMAADLSSRYGLFISDASHLAVMKMNGISNIVTNDNDFQLAEDISIYKP